MKAANALVKRVEMLEAINPSNSEEDMAALAQVKAIEGKKISRQDRWMASRFYREQANIQLDGGAGCHKTLCGIPCSRSSWLC